jgi:predicted tellurium resistance membrane protein TerC
MKNSRLDFVPWNAQRVGKKGLLKILFPVAALVLLGFIGGTLIVAHSGFETSPKRGGTSVFVPAPQAYFLATMLFCVSIIGWVALIRE